MNLPANLRHGLSAAHLPALDALRAIAVFLVVFYHYGYAFVPGGLGVLMFFVLSGFLITTLLLRENQKYHTVSLKLFYLRRSLRIFPAFSAYWLLIVGGLLAFHKPIVWPQAWASLFYVNDYYQAIFGDPNTALSHTWSLGIEEQFYILWPLTFLWLRNDLRKAALSVTGFVAILGIYRFILFFAGVHPDYFYEAFDTRADSLLVGCLLAILLHAASPQSDGIAIAPSQVSSSTPASEVSASRWPGSMRTGSMWTFLCDRPWKPLIPIALLAISSALQFRFGDTWRNLFGLLIEPWLVAALIVQWIALSPSTSAWRWLNAPPLVFLGRISYSIYLYQQVIVVFARRPFPSKPLGLAIAIIGVIAAASFSYYAIETPFLRLKDRLARSPH